MRKSKLRSYFLRFTALLSARIFNMVANIVALLFVARWVGPDAFAPLAESQSLLLTVSGLAALGIPLFTLRAAALGHDDAVGFGLAINLVSTFAISAVGLVAAITGSSLGSALVMALAVAIACEKNQEVRIGLGIEFGAVRLVNTMIALRGVILLGALAIAATSSLDPVMLYILARLIGSVTAALGMYYKINRWPIKWKAPKDDSLASLGGFIVGDIVGAFRNLDVWIVGIFSTPLNAGLYGAINKVSAPVSLFTGSLRTVIMGSASRSTNSAIRQAVRRIVIISLVVFIPIILISIYAHPIVSIILGAEFLPATSAFIWVLFSTPALVASPLVGTFLQASGLTKKIAWNTGIWNLALIIGIAIGVITFGVTGAAAALTMTTWGKYISLLVVTERTYRSVSINKSVSSRALNDLEPVAVVTG